MKVYDQIAQEFDSSRHYKWPFITEFINEYVETRVNKKDKKEKESISQIKGLDIGCGNGRNIEAYNTDNINIVGIDSSIEFCRICKEKQLLVYNRDMCDPDFEENSFDFLLVIASFHHLDTVDKRKKALQEMNRILNPDGRILLSVWSKTQPKKTKRTFDNYGDVIVPWKSNSGQIYNRYYYIFRKEELEELFVDSGFKIIEQKWDCGNEIYILSKNKV